MEWINFLTANDNIPFAVAAGLMLAIGLMELFTGSGLSEFLDNLIPDFDADIDVDVDVDVDVDADVDFDGPVLGRLFSWIKVKGVPVLVVFLCFLFCFASIGYLGQNLYHGITGHYIVWWLACIPSFILSLPFVRYMSLFLAKFLIKDITNAVSSDSFIGKLATIVTGTAKHGMPAEARLKDHHGNDHYIRVVPDEKTDEYPKGTKVYLVRRLQEGSSTFIAVKESLIDV